MSKIKLENKFTNKKLILGLIILVLISVTIGVAYSYFMIGDEQEKSNTFFTVGCLNVEIISETNAIDLNDAVPISDVEGLKEKGYTFTIENTCSTPTNYEINLETMNNPEESNSLNPEYVRVSLSGDTFDNIITKLSENEPTTNYIEDSYNAYNLYIGTIEGKAKKTFKLREWIDYDATKEEANKVYKSSINVVAGTEKTNTLPEIKTRYEAEKLVGTITGSASNVKYCLTHDQECEPNNDLTIENGKVSIEWQIDNETSFCSTINNTEQIYCSEVIFDTTPPTEPNVRLEDGILHFEGSEDDSGSVTYHYSLGCTNDYVEGSQVTIDESGKVCVYAEDVGGNKSQVVERQLTVLAAATELPDDKYYCEDTGNYQDEVRCTKTVNKQYTETYTQTCTTKGTTTYGWNTGTTTTPTSCTQSTGTCASAGDVGHTQTLCSSKIPSYRYEFGSQTSFSNRSNCSSNTVSSCSSSTAGQTNRTCNFSPNYSYGFTSRRSFSGESYCSENTFTCNASHYGDTYKTCNRTTSYYYDWNGGSTSSGYSSCSESSQSCSSSSHEGNTKVTCSKTSSPTYKFESSSTDYGSDSTCKGYGSWEYTKTCNESFLGKGYAECNASGTSYGWSYGYTQTMTSVCSNTYSSCSSSGDVGNSYRECLGSSSSCPSGSFESDGSCRLEVLAGKNQTTCPTKGGWSQLNTKPIAKDTSGSYYCIYTASKQTVYSYRINTCQDRSSYIYTEYKCTKTGSETWSKTTYTCTAYSGGSSYSGYTQVCDRSENGGTYSGTEKTCNQIDESYYNKTVQTCELKSTSQDTLDEKTLTKQEGGCSDTNRGCAVTETNCKANGTVCSQNETCSGSCTAVCDASYDGVKKYYCKLTGKYYETEEEATKDCTDYCSEGYQLRDKKCIKFAD